MYDYIVIGKGLMGTSAFYHLSQRSDNIALIGPDEPAERSSHDGVFGAHYDQGRLARRLSRDHTWAELSKRAYDQFFALEQESGITFFTQAGGVMVVDPQTGADYLRNIHDIAESYEVPFEVLDHRQQRAQFPYLAFPEEHVMVWEQPPAGFLNPRLLIEAAAQRSQQQQGKLIREIATKITPKGDHVEIETREGGVYKTRKVMVAAGGFSNSYDLLSRKAAMKLKIEHVVLGRVSAAEAARLSNMPTVIYLIDSDEISDIYMIRPILYPDGHYYVKMGANHKHDRFVESLEEIQTWYREGDSDAALAPLIDAVKGMIPDIDVSHWLSDRCVITYTYHGQPYIDEAVAGLVYTCIGGNGHSAKSALSIGQLATDLMVNGTWTDPQLVAEEFKLIYADEDVDWSFKKLFLEELNERSPN